MARAEIEVRVKFSEARATAARDDILGAMRLIQRARDSRSDGKRDDFLVRALGTLDRRQAAIAARLVPEAGFGP